MAAGAGGEDGSKRRHGSKRGRLEDARVVVIKITAPLGSWFLGYEDIIVQDLRITVETVRYRNERWAGRCGKRIIASLPPGILGEYGPRPRRFIAAGHFWAQMIFTKKTSFVLLDRQLRRLHTRKAKLLGVLELSEVPLHTNGSENDIRSWGTKQAISGGTVSDDGKAARDTMSGLLKTWRKLNVSFYDILADRFLVQGAPNAPGLPNLIRPATAQPARRSAPVTSP